MPRINSTDPGPWDQIIVLSQEVINDSFKQMWKLAQLDDSSPMCHYTKRTRLGDIDIYPGPPKVQLQVTKKDPMLFFQLPVERGCLDIFVSDDLENPERKLVNAANTTWVFPVNIGRKTVAKNSKEYKEFKQRAGLPNSVFSLQQLYIDASSTTAMDYKRSKLNSDWSELDKDGMSTIDTFITKWLKSAKDTNILGYSAQAEDGELNEYAPTFPPTSIDYFCYPWSGSRPRDDCDSNALSYLMMSNNKSPPVGQIFNYSGPWTDGTNSTFCMNQALFWPWLLPLLKDFTVAMTPVPDTPYVRWKDIDHDHPYSSGMSYHFGDSEFDGSAYEFSKKGANTWTWGAQNIVQRVLESLRLHTSNKATNPSNSNDYMELDETTSGINGTLSFQAGTEKIALAGRSQFDFRADHKSKRDTYTSMTFNITWTLVLALAAVEDGGVVFKEASHSVTVTHEQEGGMSWSPPAETVGNDFERDLRSRLHSKFRDIERKLLNALRNQHRLFLPGKGSFLMKDPKFNKRGDLLVDLAYNGADPPPPPRH